jgi:hypothetical protein
MQDMDIIREMKSKDDERSGACTTHGINVHKILV